MDNSDSGEVANIHQHDLPIAGLAPCELEAERQSWIDIMTDAL